MSISRFLARFFIAAPTLAIAIVDGHALQPHGLLLGKPSSTQGIDATLVVTHGSRIPVTIGEPTIGNYQFRELISQHVCHIVQPRLSRRGGFRDARKNSAKTGAHEIASDPQNPHGSIAAPITIHFAAWTRSWFIQAMSDEQQRTSGRSRGGHGAYPNPPASRAGLRRCSLPSSDETA